MYKVSRKCPNKIRKVFDATLFELEMRDYTDVSFFFLYKFHQVITIRYILTEVLDFLCTLSYVLPHWATQTIISFSLPLSYLLVLVHTQAILTSNFCSSSGTQLYHSICFGVFTQLPAEGSHDLITLNTPIPSLIPAIRF